MPTELYYTQGIRDFQVKETIYSEPAEKQRLMHLLVERVAINDDGVDIEFRTSEIKSVKEAYSEQESA